MRDTVSKQERAAMVSRRPLRERDSLYSYTVQYYRHGDVTATHVNWHTVTGLARLG